MARVRQNERVGHTEKTLPDDSGDLESVVGLLSYLPEDAMQCVLDFFLPNRAKEHRLYFCSHEKEVPSGATNFAIQGEAI